MNLGACLVVNSGTRNDMAVYIGQYDVIMLGVYMSQYLLHFYDIKWSK